MKIAVASGKGGTGKTTISSSLFSVWERKVTAVDFDVEEPNLHLFLKPIITDTDKTYLTIPKIDMDKCISCGKCSDFCQFNALSMINGKIMFFPEMCHACQGCFLKCEYGAILKSKKEIGEIIKGYVSGNNFYMGRLKIGEPASPPLMRKLKEVISKEKECDFIIDAPPGTSCPAMNAVNDVDYIVLVTEPTPFGVYDLSLAIEAFKPFKKHMGIVVNRSNIGDDKVYECAKKYDLPILAEIPFSREIAKNYAKGNIISNISDDYKNIFKKLASKILEYA